MESGFSSRLSDRGGDRRDQRRRTPARPLSCRRVRPPTGTPRGALPAARPERGTQPQTRRLHIASVEGAVVMCRAEHSTAPIGAAADLHDLLPHALRKRPGAEPGLQTWPTATLPLHRTARRSRHALARPSGQRLRSRPRRR
jgi:hypothetical protein